MSAFPPNVYEEIRDERARQVSLWGVQDHAPAMWLAILTEEVGEVSKEIADARLADFHSTDYRTELIQVAAVAVAAVEALDRMSPTRAPVDKLHARHKWLHTHPDEPFPPEIR